VKGSLLEAMPLLCSKFWLFAPVVCILQLLYFQEAFATESLGLNDCQILWTEIDSSSLVVKVKCLHDDILYLQCNDIVSKERSVWVDEGRRFSLTNLASNSQYECLFASSISGHQTASFIIMTSSDETGFATTSIPETIFPTTLGTTSILDETVFPTTSNPQTLDEPLSVPSDECISFIDSLKTSRVKLSVICGMTTGGKVKYGMTKSHLDMTTDKISFAANEAELVTLEELQPSTVYYYAIVYSGQWGTTQNFTTAPANATYWWPCNLAPPNIVLSRPTNESISAVIRSSQNATISLLYGLQPSVLDFSTNNISVVANETVIVKIKGLQPNNRYSYKIKYQYNTSCAVQDSDHYFFNSQRDEESSSFSFVITSDTHWHDEWQPHIFEQSLESIHSDAQKGEADFLLELGDTFMGEKLGLDETTIHKPYESLFGYYSSICHSVPLYLVTGNHEGENGWEIEDENSMPIHTAMTRKKYFANPEPDFFYGGNEKIQFEKLGLQGDYFSWEWGNALFIALDPFWYTQNKPLSRECQDGPGWCFTLGNDQYNWLYNTLGESDATFKYIFIHNLLGGTFGNSNETDRPYTGAGSAEWSRYFEWGGYNEDGTWGFDQHRPGWLNVSLHQMFVKNNVTVVFKGHDHFYSKSTRDGIIYQTVPRPSFAKSADLYTASLKGYAEDEEVLIDGGYLNVHVSETCTSVFYKTYEGDLVQEYSKCV